MNRFTLVFLLIAGLLLPASALAQNRGNNTASERQAMQSKKNEVEYEAQQHVEALFSRLCPGRCELVEVRATMERPRPVGQIAPGFEDMNTGAYEVTVRQLDVTILLDSKLPRNFQSNIPRMLQFRMAELAPSINIRPEVLDFPEPQLAPMPPLMPEPPRRAQEPPPPMPELPEPAPEPAPVLEQPAPPGTPLWQQLLPWIGLFVTLLILSGLILLILRKLGELQKQTSEEPKSPENAKQELPPPDLDALRREMKSSRAVLNRVLRRWIDDDTESVGILVRLLGPDILADLRPDQSLRPKLEAVSDAVARNAGSLEPSEIQRVVDEAHARLTAVRILHDGQGLAMDWEFLEGLSIANLRRIFAPLGATEKSYAIGQLPPAMRSRYLEGLDTAERRDLMLSAGVGELLTKEQAIDLATRVRKAADSVSHIGREAEGQAILVLDMIHALGLAEQEETLRDLHQRRPEVAQVVLDRICIETTCLGAPQDVLADALHRTPIEVLTAFVRGTREDIREHLVRSAPNAVRQNLAAELSLEIPVGRAEFLEARSEFLKNLATMLRRDGHDLAAINVQAVLPTRKFSSSVPSEATS